MGVDTILWLPAQTRLNDFADVTATLLGHPTRVAQHDDYESCEVTWVSVRPAPNMPGCADVAFRDRGEIYRRLLFQYECDSPPPGMTGPRVIIVRSTPLGIALATRAVAFFGGAVCYQDTDGRKANISRKAPCRVWPDDGEPWRQFQQEKSLVRALTRKEVNASATHAAYQAWQVGDAAPWLEKLWKEER